MKRLSIILLAVVLITSSAGIYGQSYGKKIVASLTGGKANKNTKVESALGAPDIPNPAPQNVYGQYTLSLGGGFVIIDMEKEVIDGQGDDIIIYEVGASYKTAVNEAFYVKGSIDNSPGSWVYLGEYPGDKTGIDLGKFGVKKIRYIAIFDKPVKADDNSASPGADIDAVEAVH